jgi:hypothetical protein
MEYFCLLKFYTVYPKKQKHNAEATLIPAPDKMTPIVTIVKLNPRTTINEPKVATPKAILIVLFRPMLSAVNEETMKPSNEPK